MRARRMRRRLFNAFAFAFLAFALYLVAFKKDDPMQTGQTVHVMKVASTASVNIGH